MTARGLRVLYAAAAVLAALTASTVPALAQTTGTIRGTVVDATSQRPLSGAQVFVPSPAQGAVAGTALGTITDNQGRFLIPNVPAGQHTVRVQLIGYEQDTRTVTVEAGQSAAVTFRINPTALQLDEVVVTGVAGATPKAKLPFSVDKLNVEDLPVPATTAASALQGKAAGVHVSSGTGQPGQAPSILLRGATSIMAGGSGGRDDLGRIQGPLLIIDGVIASGDQQALADIDPNNIESIEVVKGAAAASLYGSRAASGVIQIQTKRGSQLQDDQTRYTLRTEYGQSDLANRIGFNNSHAFRLDPGGTTFVDTLGNPVTFEDAVPKVTNTSRLFHDNPFPGQTFDQLDLFFNPGQFVQNYISAEGRSGNTNYYASFSNLNETGVVRFNDGYNRQSFRLNLDHGLRDDLQVSLSTSYSTSSQDLLDEGEGATPFFNLTFVSPVVDLLKMNEETGQLEINMPRSLEENPLYAIRYRDLTRDRKRFMGSGLIRWAPLVWFDLEGNVSYDRSDENTSSYYPKGYAAGAVDPSPFTSGQVTRWADDDEALNASATASLYRSFGRLTTKTKARYLYEDASEGGFYTQAGDLVAANVPTLTVAAGDKLAESYQRDIRSEGYFLITSLDLDDKYIADALVRRDGSSLFGADERWQTYYRLSGAWRVGREPWFQIPGMNEFKLRGSYGTAGGRPRFEAQYETYNVVLGKLVPATIGNRELKPEFSREIEVGLDTEFFDRIGLGITYADTRTEDQILPVPLPGFAGFRAQWRNVGVLQSNSWEGSLEATLAQTRNLSWSGRVLFDRTRTIIDELDIAPFGTGSSTAYRIAPGLQLGTFYGHKFARSCSDLSQAAQQFCSQFVTNDDGYLVWTGGQALTAGVGPDGKAGTNDDVWGTTCSKEVAGLVQSSVGCEFGLPVYSQCENANGDPSVDCVLGVTQPDFNLSFSSNLNWKGVGLYALLDGSFGFDVYNLTGQWAYREEMAAAVDQAGKPETEKKPVKYYLDLYDIAAVNNHFVEDGTYMKLRELSLRYTFNQDQLRRMRIPGSDRISLGLIGRNLLTWTNYSGYDPEVGNPYSEFGSAVIDRFDGYQYPNFRTLTGGVEISF